MKPLSLYLHIPFCIRKCHYCDFLSFQADAAQVRDYVETLLAEIDLEAPSYKEYEVQTIFFGGGTPSLLDGQTMVRIMESLCANFSISKDAEITIEVNPGTATLSNLISYRKAGINRLSIGLQSAVDEQLLTLGRIHKYDQFLSTYRAAHEAGFDNVNIDLMSALPGQTWESYLWSLEKVLSLTPRPTHISAYSLIVEEGTPLCEWVEQGKVTLPEEEEERRMYALTLEVLRKNGYDRYEISNYALPGYECRHNCVYWTRGDYLGMGLGAASLVCNKRWSNESEMKNYKERISSKRQVSVKQELSRTEQMEEFMFLGLRLVDGVSVNKFEETFEVSVSQVYDKVLSKHQKDGLLTVDEQIRLTEKGLDVSNYVMADFLL